MNFSMIMEWICMVLFQILKALLQGARFHSFTHTVILVVVNYDSSHSCPGPDWRELGCTFSTPATTTNIQQSYTFPEGKVGEVSCPTVAPVKVKWQPAKIFMLDSSRKTHSLWKQFHYNFSFSSYSVLWCQKSLWDQFPPLENPSWYVDRSTLLTNAQANNKHKNKSSLLLTYLYFIQINCWRCLKVSAVISFKVYVWQLLVAVP